MDDQTRQPLKARTLLAQAMGAGDPVTKALVPPIHMSATYLRDADNGYSGGYVYGRTDNASVQQVEALARRARRRRRRDDIRLRHGGGDLGISRA